MTLSYSVGLTTGSAVAYLLDDWLGPHPIEDPCLESLFNVTGVPFPFVNGSAAPQSLFDLIPIDASVG